MFQENKQIIYEASYMNSSEFAIDCTTGEDGGMQYLFKVETDPKHGDAVLHVYLTNKADILSSMMAPVSFESLRKLSDVIDEFCNENDSNDEDDVLDQVFDNEEVAAIPTAGINFTTELDVIVDLASKYEGEFQLNDLFNNTADNFVGLEPRVLSKVGKKLKSLGYVRTRKTVDGVRVSVYSKPTTDATTEDIETIAPFDVLLQVTPEVIESIAASIQAEKPSANTLFDSYRSAPGFLPCGSMSCPVCSPMSK